MSNCRVVKWLYLSDGDRISGNRNVSARSWTTKISVCSGPRCKQTP